jgi:hypothetical protein
MTITKPDEMLFKVSDYHHESGRDALIKKAVLVNFAHDYIHWNWQKKLKYIQIYQFW